MGKTPHYLAVPHIYKLGQRIYEGLFTGFGDVEIWRELETRLQVVASNWPLGANFNPYVWSTGINGRDRIAVVETRSGRR